MKLYARLIACMSGSIMTGVVLGGMYGWYCEMAHGHRTIDDDPEEEEMNASTGTRTGTMAGFGVGSLLCLVLLRCD